MSLTGRTRHTFRRAIRALALPRAPRHLAARFRAIDDTARRRIEEALRTHYFTPHDDGYADSRYLASDDGRYDLEQHLTGRLDTLRRTAIPWLASMRPLDHARILEIGCGTGSSTVALAEQGARVTAIDFVELSLRAARERCDAYALDVDIRRAKATEAHTLFAGETFDFIIFFATLGHMVHDERIAAMRSTWDMLSPGSLWCVIETPNRLGYDDRLTSTLPFLHWLPDDLAFRESRFSPRRDLAGLYRDMDPASMVDFLSHGRGVSRHDFELALGPVEKLDVVSGLAEFLRRQRLAARLLYRLRRRPRHLRFLTRVGPRVHAGFFEESLDLALRKQ